MTKYDFIKDIIEENILIKIGVQDFAGNEIGYLRPLTKNLIENERSIITKLTEWRNQFSMHFFSTFIATEERTKYWLQNQVLNKSDKLLFLIYSQNNLVGHLGFTNFNFETVELDNLVRGELGGHSQLIFYAESALIDWIFQKLELKIITAQILSRNILSIFLQQKLKFRIKNKIYLNEILENDEALLVETIDNKIINPRLFKYVVFLTKDDFYNNHESLKNENYY